MANIVTIESKPAQGASQLSRNLPLPQAPRRLEGLHVTDRAVKRIRVAWPRKASRPRKAACAWA